MYSATSRVHIHPAYNIHLLALYVPHPQFQHAMPLPTVPACNATPTVPACSATPTSEHATEEEGGEVVMEVEDPPHEVEGEVVQ